MIIKSYYTYNASIVSYASATKLAGVQYLFSLNFNALQKWTPGK